MLSIHSDQIVHMIKKVKKKIKKNYKNKTRERSKENKKLDNVQKTGPSTKRFSYDFSGSFSDG